VRGSRNITIDHVLCVPHVPIRRRRSPHPPPNFTAHDLTPIDITTQFPDLRCGHHDGAQVTTVEATNPARDGAALVPGSPDPAPAWLSGGGERETLVGEASRIITRVKSAFVRLGRTPATPISKRLMLARYLSRLADDHSKDVSESGSRAFGSGALVAAFCLSAFLPA
jgi:hypothetical protein